DTQSQVAQEIYRTPREAGDSVHESMPARSRHCEWGVTPDPGREPLGRPRGRPGRPGHDADPRARRPGCDPGAPTPFEAKGVVDATAGPVASGSIPGGPRGGRGASAADPAAASPAAGAAARAAG